MQHVTAIIPAYNEQISIGSMVLKTKQYVDRVIVVDDGSTDKTVEISKLAGAEVISHPTNMGKGVALKTGFKAVTDQI
jgi:glycosyltransferase involved in cell wall biosynthesis